MVGEWFFGADFRIRFPSDSFVSTGPSREGISQLEWFGWYSTNHLLVGVFRVCLHMDVWENQREVETTLCVIFCCECSPMTKTTKTNVLNAIHFIADRY